ncbi:MAG: DNA damage-inducible protein D [Bacilli bacterium]|nr:DNA damage-inducible protein D [Bacilli bacterium]
MLENSIKSNNNIFESIKHIDDDGNEYWYARELMKALGYIKWDNFYKVIQSAKLAIMKSCNNPDERLPEVRKSFISGNGAVRYIIDYKLSRYACYLIAQEADSRKKVVALAKSYFAIQTRKMELIEENYKNMSEDEKRLQNRQLVKKKNTSLRKTAAKSGVKNFALFNNAGYKGLYDGRTADDIFKEKKLNYRNDILDYMCSGELIANLFRINQTEEALINKNVESEKEAVNTHFIVGKNVRDVIIKSGGTLPENYPTPVKSIKDIEKSNNKKLVP